MEKRTFLTKSKYESYKKQLEYMEGEGLQLLATLLGKSPGSGMGRPLDLPIHDFARQFYSEIELIKSKLKSHIIIDEYIKSIKNKEIIDIGAHVTIYDIDYKEEESFFILDSDEADPHNNKISYKSPLGKELIGKAVGDFVILEKNSYRGKITSLFYKKFNFSYSPRDWKSLLVSLKI